MGILNHSEQKYKLELRLNQHDLLSIQTETSNG